VNWRPQPSQSPSASETTAGALDACPTRWTMSKAEEFRVVRYPCRIYPAVCANPHHLLAPIALLSVNIPHIQRHTQGHALRNTGRAGEDLLKRTFSYIMALALARASRQCRDAIQAGCRISRTLRVGHGVHGSGVTSESKRSAKNIGGGGSGGVSIFNSSVTHVLVSDRVVGFCMSEQINLTRAGGTSNDSGIDVSSL